MALAVFGNFSWLLWVFLWFWGFCCFAFNFVCLGLEFANFGFPLGLTCGDLR